MSRLALAGAALFAAVALAAQADAALPGANGRIAFQRLDPANGIFDFLYAANPDGSHLVQLTSAPSFFSGWAPDGTRLAYDFVDADGDDQIATVRPDGTGTAQLTFGPTIHEAPSFSPDGTRIAYYDSAESGGSKSIYLIRPDGTDNRVLVQGRATGQAARAAFSPDGTRIAFACGAHEGRPSFDIDLCVMNADGSGTVDVTNTPSTPDGPVFESRPSWGTAPPL
jgi:TolB protein